LKRPRGRNLDQIIAERRARRQSRLRAILLALLAVLAVVAGIRKILEVRRNPNFAARRTIVVPFDNRTGDAAWDTLGLVASDWITSVLTLYAPTHETVPTTTILAYEQSAQLARFDLLSGLPAGRAHKLLSGVRFIARATRCVSRSRSQI
jgi:hypothetical protein